MFAIGWLLLAAMGQAQPEIYPTFTGLFERIDSKTIVLKIDDREVDFRRTRRTRFAKGAEPETLKEGDLISIEAAKDIEGGLAAMHVFREKQPPSPEEKLMARAYWVAAEFSRALPNYVCRKTIVRKTGRRRRMRVQDTVSATVVLEDGTERYDEVRVNDRPASADEAGSRGVWSTGEFSSLLADVFSPRTAARFQYRRDETLAGRRAARYDFTVTQANSHWNVQVADLTVTPGYTGAVWLERETARALRVETAAVGLPDGFPLGAAEMTADYDYVALADGVRYLLPVRAVTLACERTPPRYCARNEVEFRDYRRYTGQSSITYQP